MQHKMLHCSLSDIFTCPGIGQDRAWRKWLIPIAGQRLASILLLYSAFRLGRADAIHKKGTLHVY
jgi:hypothetical protein